jgi:undecaprenyl pyrophosphate phosphatase UppP
MSALWHGFYPGYFMFFLSVPLITMVERVAKKKISPNYSSEKWSLYGIACILATSFVVEYMVSAFSLLSFWRSFNNWKQFHFFGHILCVVAYVALTYGLPSPKKKAE